MTKKRLAIPKKLRAQAMAKNSGICMHAGCTKPGFICEHVIPWFFVQEHKLENLEPRCREHAREKTTLDQANIGHVRRMSGESGQQARLRRRKAQGLGSKLQSRRKIVSAGFDKRVKRKMDGTTEVQ